MIKHATAGALLFGCGRDGGWRLGLIEHPRLGRWMAPGGHVEVDECQAQAAVREIAEETGLTSVRLVPLPTMRLPAGFPSTHAPMPLPWWITEVQVGADNHLAEPHVHVDHQYVAVADDPTPGAKGEHPFGWFTAAEVARLRMFEDTQLLAGELFPQMDRLAGVGTGTASPSELAVV
jgi:8-oxo-dGTP pyrophosphatase MutT (NUDIX family)